MEPIDSLIDRLDDALRSAGFDGLTPPRETAALDEVVAEVAPYELPDDLRRFWKRVEPLSIRVTLFPELIGTAFALDSYRMAREPSVSPRLGPPLLFPIAYSSQVFRLIELQSELDPGGTIFYCEVDDTRSFPIDYESFSALLEVLVEAVEEGAFDKANAVVRIEVEAERRARARAGTHRFYGNRSEIPNELTQWPAHWLQSSGIDLTDRPPLGATHTIADLVVDARNGSARGRIAGRVVRLAGSAAGTLVVVGDGSGELELWCPAGVSPWGPLMGGAFEFALTVEGDPPTAVANDVRPLD